MPVKKIRIRRKKQFRASFMRYWVVLSISKKEFMEKYKLSDELSCEVTEFGQPVPRIEFHPQEWGIPIKNGETLELEMIDDGVKSVFAVTVDGRVSNEILLEPSFVYYELLVTTEGGWKAPPFPVLVQEQAKI